MSRVEGGPFLFPPSMRELLLNTDYTPTLLVMTIMSISKMRGVVITSLGHTVCRVSSTDLAHASLKLTSKADGQCLFSAGRWRLRDVM